MSEAGSPMGEAVPSEGSGPIVGDKSRLFEIDIPVKKHGDMSFDQQEEERQRTLALRGSLEGDEEKEQEVMEVYYNDGATDLFLAIEETDWRRALHIIHQKPVQAKVWVISTGTVETTFGWSLWRRLPLHEACRRQGPAWLISALLSVYPAAAQQATQFGELPLHLAVECGSPPEVVNLLVVCHWHGIAATDQSGRTPLEILQDSEMLAMEDHQVVFESLTRSQETYQTMIEQHQEEVKGIKVRHSAGLVAIRQQHDEDLQQEQEQQDKLVAEVERLRRLVDEAKITDQKHSEQINHLSQVATTQKSNLDHLEDKLTKETSTVEQKTAKVANLEKQVANKNHQIASLQNQVQELQQDMQRIVSWQQETLGRQINSTEESMQQMVEQFVSLVEILGQHGLHMTSLLKSRNIPLPVSTPKQQPKTTPTRKKTEEKKSEETDLDETFLNNIAAAASSALQS